MEIGNIRLQLNRFGDDVPKLGVTPAECAVLIKMHGDGFNKPITGLEVVEEDERTNGQEFERLLRNYGKAVSDMFPGNNPKLPETFKEVGL